jgi:hypothetical protein
VQKLTEAERQEANANTSSIKTTTIRENAFVQRRSNWSLLRLDLLALLVQKYTY